MTTLVKLGDSITQCFYCERPFIDANYGTNKPGARTRDHIVALSKGGSNHSRNMVYCCRECNSLKGGFSLQEFIDLANEYIALGKRYKTIPVTLIALIVSKATLLVYYAEEKGDKLYRKEGEKVTRKKKPSLVGDYLRRNPGEPKNTSYPTIAAINKLARKKPIPKYIEELGADAHLSVNTNTSRILAAEPEPNFHYL